ncbi:MAG: sulfatase [Acidobacteria bacterium]|nr:sulfatase [Acidobacteriota bacterium]
MPISRRAFLATLAATATAQPIRPPNIILIMADDMGWGDLSCQGSPDIRTPHIDRMAAEGTRFTHFYAQPLCGPSRAALMTGCYPVRNSLMFNHLPKARTGIHPNEMTIPEVLKQKGYATMAIGKWHLGDAPPFLPVKHGFDHWFDLPYSNDMWPFHPKIVNPARQAQQGDTARARAKLTGYDGEGQIYPPDWFPDLPLMRDGDVAELNPEQNQLTERYTREALNFITANKARPFFIYLAHTMPHVPLFPGKNFEGKSPRGRYGDVIEELDASVGAILEHVQKQGLDSETLVIFTSDNGPWAPYGIDAGSAGPLRGAKGSHWEGGIRVPFIARWSGRVRRGVVTNEIAASIDLLPTFTAFADAHLPAHKIDGLNLAPFLIGAASKSPRDDFFYYAAPAQYLAADGRPANQRNLVAVRSGPWKLHVATGELYNLREDTGEQKNVAAKYPQHAAGLRAMGERFNAAIAEEVRPLGAQ